MNAPEPATLSMRLREWLARRFGGQVDDVSPPARATGGRDYATYLLHFSGAGLTAEWAAPLVARLTPFAARYEALRREAQLQAWCAEHGFVAPAVLAVLAPGDVAEGPVEVMGRLPGVTMADAMLQGRAGLAERLGALLADLHGLPVPHWAAQQDPWWSVAERRLALARFVASQEPGSALRSALERTERLLPSLAVPDPVVCHGDFHPYNILVDQDSLGVIDWTDAGTGDRHADISWTTCVFEMASVLPAEALRSISESFVAGYELSYAIEPTRLARWRPLAVLHQWAMTVAESSGLWGAGTPATAGPTDRSEWLRREFDKAMLAT